MAPASDDDVVLRFDATSGRALAVVALVVCAGVVLAVLVQPVGDATATVVAAATLAGVLAWAVMLRPALWVTAEDLVMRNAFETVRVPLAAIERVAVSRVTAVAAGGRRFVSTVVHRSLRTVVGAVRAAEPKQTPYADVVEQQISQLAADARQAAGIRLLSDEQRALADRVHRQPAWLPIGLIAASVLALVVSLVA